MAVDDNGNALWTTKNGHGDAMHVGDLDPSRSGLEEFEVDEDGSKPSSWMADARTGRVLWSTPAYRTAPAWQNTAYNQPPHPSFFIGNGMATPPRPTVSVP